MAIYSLPSSISDNQYIAIPSNDESLIGQYFNRETSEFEAVNYYAMLNESGIAESVTFSQYPLETTDTVIEITYEQYATAVGKYWNGTEFIDPPISVLAVASTDEINYKGENKWLSEKLDEIEESIANISLTPGADGADGKSAYQIAVDNGFEGTETAWLASLVGATGATGEKGDKGDKGETGTAGAKGDKGDTGATGATGAQGLSAYQVAVANGFEGSETAWLASLVGATGAQGIQGIQGEKGDKGDTGAAGTAGAQGEKGDKGDKGDTGATGANGATFTPSVSSDGTLSWTNDKGLSNPSSVNIKGAKGDKGDTGATGAQGATGAKGDTGDSGATFTPSVTADGVLSWTNNKGLPNPTSVNIKGSDATVTVDNALSSTSTNAVQNKVVNAALAGKSPSNHNHNSAYIKKSLQMTADDGDVELSWSGQDVVAKFKALGSGVTTVYSPAGATNNPNSTESFRFMIHKTGSASFGWIMAFGAQGSVYTGYVDSGTWKGWKALFEAAPSPLWTGGYYMTEGHTVTPSKKLSECRNGWILLWSDFDPGEQANNTDFYATVICKKAYAGQNWAGGEWYCDVPRYSAGTATDSESRIIKVLQIYDAKIVGTSNNAAAPRNDVVLRAVYEF